MLALYEYMWCGEGPGLNANRRAIAFEVVGLPEKRQAWIADMNHRWQILLATNGVYSKWAGRYRSAKEALAAVSMYLEREQ
jgi:hypothetical protein